MSVYDKLGQLGITLPPVAVPAAAYVPFVQTGHLIFLSGHIAKREGKAWVGQLGADMNTEQGKAAARAIAIDLMGTLHAACQASGKTLDMNVLEQLSHSCSGLSEQRIRQVAARGLACSPICWQPKRSSQTTRRSACRHPAPGSDRAAGPARIHEAGGLVIAQDPRAAGCPLMPEVVIGRALVDAAQPVTIRWGRGPADNAPLRDWSARDG